MTSERIDIGHGHFVEFVGWHPDRTLNPRYADLQDVDRWGVEVFHPSAKSRGDECFSFVTFDGEAQRQVAPHQPKWAVESLDPLTVSPSLLCGTCGDHGFIRAGKWVPA